jgi:hypothetical protein
MIEQRERVSACHSERQARVLLVGRVVQEAHDLCEESVRFFHQFLRRKVANCRPSFFALMNRGDRRTFHVSLQDGSFGVKYHSGQDLSHPHAQKPRAPLRESKC